MASGPFPSLDGSALDRLPTLEHRLPVLFVLGFIALMAIQLGLHL